MRQVAQQLDVAAPSRRISRRPRRAIIRYSLQRRTLGHLDLCETSFVCHPPCPLRAGCGLDTVLEGHRDAVQAVALLSDHRIVSGSRDGTLRIWRDTEVREACPHRWPSLVCCGADALR